MNILLVGEESAGIQTLRALTNSDHKIVGVMASPSRKNIRTATLWDFATKLGCQTWPANLVKDPDFAQEVRAQEVDILLNIHSLFIINGEVLNAPRIGSFNMHPGPLPRYAGLNAVNWAIYRGETSHGVTIHKMVPELDAGPMVYQTILEIEDADTGLSLSSKCVKAGIELMLQLVQTASIDPGAIPLVPQDLAKREYFGREVPNEGRLRWSSPAREIVNFIRASDFFPFPSPWEHPRAVWRDKEIRVVKARISGCPCDAAPGTVGEFVESGVQIASSDEWVIATKLILDGRYLNAADVLVPGTRLLEGSSSQSCPA
jgi:UDP-4-amino-4-deoxy-L-arabinose formyltransferase/UDP-glucuronic acid dehydrogenase (UDP-4-keto-hexauronic acid decarboxylating)